VAHLARSAALFRAAAKRRIAALVSGHWRPCRPRPFGARPWPLSIKRRSDAQPTARSLSACKFRSKPGCQPQRRPVSAVNGHRLGQQHCPNITCQILATETSVRLSLNSLSEVFHRPVTGAAAGARALPSRSNGEAGRGFLANATTSITRPPLRGDPPARWPQARNSTFDAALMARVRRALLWQPHVGGCLIFVASGS
jgi:hypothetical protein